MTMRHHLWFILPLVLLAVSGSVGCSSLPKHPVQDSELSHRAASFNNLGNKSYKAGQYTKAAKYFEQALAIHASVDDRAGVSRSLASLGRTQLALGALDASGESFRRALNATQAIQRPNLAAQAIGGLGALALRRGQPLEAMGWIEKALDLPLADPGTERAVLLHDQGVAHWKLGNMEAARTSFQLALAMHESLQDNLGIAADCYSLALLEESAGDFEGAMPWARRALSHDKNEENSPGIAQDLTLLGSLASQNSLPEEAVDYYQRAQLAWQAMGRNEKAAEVSALLEILVTKEN